MLIALGLTFAMYFFALPLLAQLTDLENVLEETHKYGNWLVILPLAGVWCYLLDGIFIGAGQMAALRKWMLFSVFVVFFPCVDMVKTTAG